MPALCWRTMPARSISRCETICASAGFSRSVGRKNRLERMGLEILGKLRKKRSEAATLGKARQAVHGRSWVENGLFVRQLLAADCGQGRGFRIGQLLAVIEHLV